jgi:50S ribosomal protein L16 3-hydroxylase
MFTTMMIHKPSNSISFLTSDAFFRDYWQKKPLCLRQALPNFQSPISADELAGLACEDFVESRLVLEHGDTPWQLKHGPFTEKDFATLPERHWSLLVQAVNHYMPAVNDLLQYFNFLPSYYLDDVMVSYAPEQSGVGPHFDYYDVFILQGTGKRHWRLGEFCTPETAIVKDSKLSILQEFNTQEEHILELGDILYIPQQQAHWCVAAEAGLSYSIGFRTPAHSELLQSFAAEMSHHTNESQRFKILAQSVAQAPTKITDADLSQLQQIMQGMMQNPQLLLNWIGRYVTEPKYPDIENQVPSKKYTDIHKELSRHNSIRQNESSRFAYYDAGDTVQLFIDGKYSQHPAALKPLIALLCDHRELSCKDVAAMMASDTAQELLRSLLKQGVFYFVK